MWRRPNFLIVGAAKAGTTSLYYYLRQHPEIFMPEAKEPHYFVHDAGIGSWKKYLSLFQGAGDKRMLGEASTGYLFSEESPRWIQAILGDIPIVILLRNPAGRAFSLYWWMAREGYEEAGTFSRALELEDERRTDPVFRETCPQFFSDYLYFTTGLYCEQVRRYFDTFGRERVKVCLFEDFTQDPLATCRDIFGFLGVQTGFTPELEVHNQGRWPLSIRRQYWLRNKAWRRLWFIPKKLRRLAIQRLMERNLGPGSPRPDQALQVDLLRRYEQDIQNTEKLLRRDLGIWHGRKALRPC
jgi:hypothetical protein